MTSSWVDSARWGLRTRFRKATGMMTAISATFLLVGCAQPFTMQSEYRPTDHDWARANGTATLSGEAFLRTRGGDVKTCAGRPIAILPDTAYTKELMAKGISSHFGQPTNFDSRAKGLFRTSQCNAAGKFIFRSLPAGHWIVVANVTWETGNATTGGDIIGQAETTLGQVSDTIVTR